MPQYPLGRFKQHDPRSRAYAYKAAAPRALASVRHASHIGILDQGNLGSCTGNATVGALGCDPYYATQKLALDEKLAVSVYSFATQLDDFSGTYPPTDTGSSGLAAAKAAQKLGLISGYQHAFNLSAALTALQAGPIITGIDWYESFYTPSTAGLVSIQRGDRVAGGHEVVLDEYDDANQLVWCRNSWGSGWSVGGRFCMSVSTWSQLLAQDGDATIFTPLTQPAPTPAPPPDDVDARLWSSVKTWAEARHTGCNKAAATAVKGWASGKGYV